MVYFCLQVSFNFNHEHFHTSANRHCYFRMSASIVSVKSQPFLLSHPRPILFELAVQLELALLGCFHAL